MEPITQSIRDKLRDKAWRAGITTEDAYWRFIADNIVSGLFRSRHCPHFSLKGAMLFGVWYGHSVRITRRVDLECLNKSYSDAMADVIADAAECAMGVGGPSFDVRRLRPSRRTMGMVLPAQLGPTHVDLQIVTRFRNAGISTSEYHLYQDLLARRPPMRILCCSPAMMLVEKLATIVEYGCHNTRAWDYYDAYILVNHCCFQDAQLLRTVNAVFSERGVVRALHRAEREWEAGFSNDAASGTPHRVWQRWSARQPSMVQKLDFRDIVKKVGEFAIPLLAAARLDLPPPGTWRPGTGWETQATLGAADTEVGCKKV